MSSEPRPQTTLATGWRYPSPASRTLPNGLRVETFHLPGQHVISALLVLDAPLALEPQDVEGVATIAVRTSDEGTRSHPGEQLVDLIEGAGAAYDGSAAMGGTIVGIDVPATRLAAALPLLAEVVAEPDFAQADVARHVALRLAEIEQAAVNPNSLAALGVRQVLFDSASRESRPNGGRAATVARIDTATVRRHAAAHWGPHAATLVLAGDLGPGADGLVDASFGGWDGPAQPARHAAGEPSARATHDDGRRIVHLVDLPGAVQAEIRISGLGIDRSSPDFAPLQVASTAVGGSFGSRLNSVLREQRGYTYGAHMSVAPARVGGTWAVSTGVRTEVAAPALSDALAILAMDEPLTDQEVADAVSYQLGIAPLRYDTAAAIASQAATLAVAGWDAGFVNEHFAHVRDVTASAATSALRRIVRDQAMHVVVVGDAAVLTEQFTAGGFAVRPLEVVL